MAGSSKKKGTSVQSYRYNTRLAIRLEYDQGDERQSVFLNGELRSSFHCPVGFRAEHTFRGHDAISDERGHLGEWTVKFAVEQNTFRIRYELLRRNTGGDDTKWYWWDRNTDDWTRFPELNEGGQADVECESCGTTKKCPVCESPDTIECNMCSAELICPECNPPDTCDECGASFTCECDRGPRLVHDVSRMQEQLEQIGGERLRSAIVEIVGNQTDSAASWATLIEQVLNEAGCDISGVRLSLDDHDGNAD